MKLTDGMRSILENAVRLQDKHGADGLTPSGSGQWASVRAGMRIGLMKFVGWGVALDGDEDDVEPVYEITDAGRAALASSTPTPGTGR